MAEIISFTDRYARKLGKRIAELQQEINDGAMALLGKGGGKPARSFEEALDELDDGMKRLALILDNVESEELRTAISAACRNHARWTRAKLGSDAERDAASDYLKSLDTLYAILGVG